MQCLQLLLFDTHERHDNKETFYVELRLEKSIRYNLNTKSLSKVRLKSNHIDGLFWICSLIGSKRCIYTYTSNYLFSIQDSDLLAHYGKSFVWGMPLNVAHFRPTVSNVIWVIVQNRTYAKSISSNHIKST